MLPDLKRDVSFHIQRAGKETHAEPSKKEVAAAGEFYAQRWYESNGYRLLERNWHCGRFAEIDLILKNPEGLFVFSEVKSRLRLPPEPGFVDYGFDSITPKKRRKIMTAAQCYLHSRKVPDAGYLCDALLVTYDSIEWNERELVMHGLEVLHIPNGVGGY